MFSWFMTFQGSWSFELKMSKASARSISSQSQYDLTNPVWQALPVGGLCLWQNFKRLKTQDVSRTNVSAINISSFLWISGLFQVSSICSLLYGHFKYNQGYRKQSIRPLWSLHLLLRLLKLTKFNLPQAKCLIRHCCQPISLAPSEANPSLITDNGFSGPGSEFEISDFWSSAFFVELSSVRQHENTESGTLPTLLKLSRSDPLSGAPSTSSVTITHVV